MQDCIWGLMPGGVLVSPPSGCCKSSISATLESEAAANGPEPEREGTATLSYRGFKMPDLLRKYKVAESSRSFNLHEVSAQDVLLIEALSGCERALWIWRRRAHPGAGLHRILSITKS